MVRGVGAPAERRFVFLSFQRKISPSQGTAPPDAGVFAGTLCHSIPSQLSAEGVSELHSATLMARFIFC